MSEVIIAVVTMLGVVALAVALLRTQNTLMRARATVDDLQHQVHVLTMLTNQMKLDNERLTVARNRARAGMPPQSPWPALGWNFSITDPVEQE